MSESSTHRPESSNRPVSGGQRTGEKCRAGEHEWTYSPDHTPYDVCRKCYATATRGQRMHAELEEAQSEATRYRKALELCTTVQHYHRYGDTSKCVPCVARAALEPVDQDEAGW